MVESDIKQIAAMGSMHEVGFYEGSIDENTPCIPESYYGIAKNALREIAKILCNKIFQWLRGYYIVGNSKYGSSIFSKITEAAEAGKKNFPFTMGLNQFDFLNYDIFCKQVAAVVSQDKINGIIDNDFCDYQRSLGRKFEKLNIVLQHNFALKNKGLTLEQIQKRYRIWIPDFLTYC